MPASRVVLCRSPSVALVYCWAMFTGIVQAIGRVQRLQPNAFGAKLLIDPGDWSHRPAAGDSVAVNGCCLTYAPQGGESAGRLTFDVIRETLDRSTLGRLSAGDRVNLESSLTATTPMGGHFVQGHVDGLGRIVEISSSLDEWRTTVEVDADVMPCLVPKGSVAIDGVSLTLAGVEVAACRFTVALIPTTIDLTTLGALSVGDMVNIETDLIARTVVHWLSHWADGGGGAAEGGLTLQKLRDAGLLG